MQKEQPNQAIQKLRNKHRQEERREKHQQIFREHRQLMIQRNHELNQIEFNQTYPQIDEDNLQQHLSFIRNYSSHELYNYQMLVFVPLLHDRLIQDPQNQLILETLCALTLFQQIELPQTEQIVIVFVKILPNKSQEVLQIVSNLLSHHKYCSLMRDMLIFHDFIEIGAKTLSKQFDSSSQDTHDYMVYLYFQILCFMATTHPSIELLSFKHIVEQIHIFVMNQDYLYLLFERMGELCCSLTPNKDKANIIYEAFKEELFQQYHNFEDDTVSILGYCLRSNIKISHTFNALLTKSLSSPLSGMKQRILKILDLIYEEQKTVELMMSEDILGVLLSTFHTSQEWTKVKIMNFISKIIYDYMLQAFRETEMISEIDHASNIPPLLSIMKESLEGSVDLRQTSIDTLFKMILVFQEKEMTNTVGFLVKIEQEGIFNVIESLPKASEEVQKKIDQMLELYSSLSKNSLI